MSVTTDAAVELARPDPRSLPGEVGMVERPRARFLPFDAWHLFLAPLAFVMLLPLVWMVATSLEAAAGLTPGSSRAMSPSQPDLRPATGCAATGARSNAK